MKIIGIDPGSRLCGYGVIRVEGSTISHLDNGVIVPDAKLALPRRLSFIAEALEERLDEFHPDVASVEETFVHRFPKSALVLGQARGAAIVTLARAGLEIHEYSPTKIKQAVVGYGRAEKEQVQHMVKVLLKLPEIPEENAADALAVAICHGHGMNVQSKMRVQ